MYGCAATLVDCPKLCAGCVETNNNPEQNSLIANRPVTLPCFNNWQLNPDILAPKEISRP